MKTLLRNSLFKKAHGFSMIELAIAMAIITMLAAIAMPAYQDFSIRSKVAECIGASAPPRLSVSMFRHQTGRWPQGEQELTFATTGSVTGNGTGFSPYCSGFQYGEEGTIEGTVRVVIDVEAVDPELSLAMIAPEMVPTSIDGENIQWDCRSGATDAGLVKYLPEECQD